MFLKAMKKNTSEKTGSMHEYKTWLSDYENLPFQSIIGGLYNLRHFVFYVECWKYFHLVGVHYNLSHAHFQFMFSYLSPSSIESVNHNTVLRYQLFMRNMLRNMLTGSLHIITMYWERTGIPQTIFLYKYTIPWSQT